MYSKQIRRIMTARLTISTRIMIDINAVGLPKNINDVGDSD